MFFYNPAAEIMLNMLCNTLLKITPHNTQKKNKKKRKNSPARQAFEREGKGRNAKRKRDAPGRKDDIFTTIFADWVTIHFQTPPDGA